MEVALVFLILIYAFIFIFLSFYWNKKQSNAIQFSEIPVSIIIPFRNEEKNIAACIKSILNQNYNQSYVEIICVNDHSYDSSLQQLKDFKEIKIISLDENNFGKKAAITEGIKAAKNEIIITRDADSISQPNWLKTLIKEQQQQNADMLIGQVIYENKKSILSAMQILENLAISFTGGAMAKLGKPILCNGTNLLFKKSVFKVLNGYSSHQKIDSGDDIFLMNAFFSGNKKIAYLKDREAAVSCKTTNSISELIAQRIRWASKNKYNNNPYNFLIGSLILCANLLVIIALPVAILEKDYGLYCYLFIALKFITDFIIVAQSAKHFKQLTYLCWLPLFFCYFPLEIIIILTLSFFYYPNWKGRKLKH